MTWVVAAAAAADTLNLEVGPATRIALGIEVTPIVERGSISGAEATGVVMAPPGQSYPVSSPFPGIVLEPLVVPGMTVEAGQPVALLYSPDYAAAQAELETLVLAAERDEHVAERTRELRALGLRSEQEAEEAEHLAKVAALELRAMETRLAGISAASGAGRYHVTATVGGVVTHLLANAGESVAPSTPIMSLFQGNRYWAQVQLPERLVHLVDERSTVTLSRTDSAGRVVAIDPEVDPTTRSSEVLVELPDISGWRIGQIIDVTFVTHLADDLMTVPVRAVIRVDGQESVFVETETGFRLVAVNIVTRSVDTLVVTGNLSAGQRIAVAGLAALKNMTEGA